jgi:hypothetical protein
MISALVMESDDNITLIMGESNNENKQQKHLNYDN